LKYSQSSFKASSQFRPDPDRTCAVFLLETSRVSKNVISSIKTLEGLQSPEGIRAAITIGIDIHDSSTAIAFVAEVAERFKVQRMISPPETNALLVTLVGDLSASSFAECWKKMVADDQVLAAFMSLMRRADVLRGTASGAPEAASLLAG
jgi:hypothetical protein